MNYTSKYTNILCAFVAMPCLISYAILRVHVVLVKKRHYEVIKMRYSERFIGKALNVIGQFTHLLLHPFNNKGIIITL